MKEINRLQDDKPRISRKSAKPNAKRGSRNIMLDSEISPAMAGQPEVTPEMIRAGLAALASGLVSVEQGATELCADQLVEIYIAMRELESAEPALRT